MTPIIVEFEEKIDELGRDTWFEELESSEHSPEKLELLEKLAIYDLCKDCYIKDELNYIKYYG